MDDHRFDTFSRALSGAASSRSRLLTGGAGGAPGGQSRLRGQLVLVVMLAGTLALAGLPVHRAPGPAGVRAQDTAHLLAAGDIATCDSQNDEATAKLLDGRVGTVAALGDTVYESGSRREFNRCYDPTWGRHKRRTRPAAGNHEYNTAGATGYFDYFGRRAGPRGKGYYSYELGDWHVVVLNSQLDSGTAQQAQEEWLKTDLAANRGATCTLAYWHHPHYSSGHNAIVAGEAEVSAELYEPAAVKRYFQLLYDEGAEIVLSGHKHNYERFAPQDANGNLRAANGVRQFVVGTGGRSTGGFDRIQKNSEVRNGATFGILDLTLRSDGYDWTFVPVAGKTFTDTGSGSCH
jgi:acid phosphatase type 7